MCDYIGYSDGEWIPDSQISTDPDDLYTADEVFFMRTTPGIGCP